MSFEGVPQTNEHVPDFNESRWLRFFDQLTIGEVDKQIPQEVYDLVTRIVVTAESNRENLMLLHNFFSGNSEDSEAQLRRQAVQMRDETQKQLWLLFAEFTAKYDWRKARHLQIVIENVGARFSK